jgi:hypothetical protein
MHGGERGGDCSRGQSPAKACMRANHATQCTTSCASSFGATTPPPRFLPCSTSLRALVPSPLCPFAWFFFSFAAACAPCGAFCANKQRPREEPTAVSRRRNGRTGTGTGTHREQNRTGEQTTHTRRGQEGTRRKAASEGTLPHCPRPPLACGVRCGRCDKRAAHGVPCPGASREGRRLICTQTPTTCNNNGTDRIVCAHRDTDTLAFLYPSHRAAPPSPLPSQPRRPLLLFLLRASLSTVSSS